MLADVEEDEVEDGVDEVDVGVLDVEGVVEVVSVF